MAKLKHIAIATDDPARTKQFYEDVFDLKVVGQVDSENAEGYYLSDGNINIAILRFKNDEIAGTELGAEFNGIHHIGFQVDDLADVDSRLHKANSFPRSDINTARKAELGDGQNGRNKALNYQAPDGVLIDVSQVGWVGTGRSKLRHHTNGVHATADDTTTR